MVLKTPSEVFPERSDQGKSAPRPKGRAVVELRKPSIAAFLTLGVKPLPSLAARTSPSQGGVPQDAPNYPAREQVHISRCHYKKGMKQLKNKPTKRNVQEIEAWELFLPRLRSIKSVVDTQAVLGEIPPKGEAGRLYYSNLGWFMQFFSPPNCVSIEELTEYLRIFRHIDGELRLSPDVILAVENALESAINASQPFDLCA
jgi:hypothetical protein